MKKFLFYAGAFFVGIFSGGPIGAIVLLIIAHYMVKNKSSKKEEYSDSEEDIIYLFYSVAFTIGDNIKIDKKRILQIIWERNVKPEIKDEDINKCYIDFIKELDCINKITDSDFKEEVESLDLNDKKNILLSEINTFYPELGDELLREIEKYAKIMGLSDFYEEIKTNIRNHKESGYNQRDSQEKTGGADGIDYYSILGCSPGDSLIDIKKAYRKKMSEFHPDKISGKGLSESFMKFAEEESKKINEAYEEIVKKHR